MASSTRADEVVTRDAYLEGQVEWTAKGLRIADREVAWQDVLAAAFEAPAAPASASTVTLHDGERWAVEVLSLAAGQLRVRLGSGLEQTLPVDRVAVLTLTPVDAAALGADANTLVTSSGEALPGELMWISDTEVAIDSVFGVMQMPRSRVGAYVFEKEAAAPSEATRDQVALNDGTVLGGTLTTQAGIVTLEHPVLGRVTLDRGSIRSIRRLSNGTPLAAITATIDARPLLASSMRPIAPTAADPRLRIWPGGRVTFTLPAAGRLRAIVGPIDGSRGATILRVSSSGSVLLEKVVEQKKPPEWITVTAPAGEVTLEADFVQPIAIPSGVVLREASVEVGP